MTLTLVRHTVPDIDQGVCYGALDLNVASTFETEAAAVIESLSSAQVIVTSPLRRCRLLADEIANAFGGVAIVDDRLKEMDFGRWEGMKWDDIPRDELDAWRDDFYYANPHGGESVNMLTHRVHSAISSYRATGETHIIVCHSGVIKAAVAKDKHIDSYDISVPFGGVLELN